MWLINSAVIYVSEGFSDSTSFSIARSLSGIGFFALLEVIRCLTVTLWEFIGLNSSLRRILLLHDLLLKKPKLMSAMYFVCACAWRQLSAGFVGVYGEPRAAFLTQGLILSQGIFVWCSVRAWVHWRAARSLLPLPVPYVARHKGSPRWLALVCNHAATWPGSARVFKNNLYQKGLIFLLSDTLCSYLYASVKRQCCIPADLTGDIFSSTLP